MTHVPTMTKTVYYFPRLASGDVPGGITVSKHEKLPDGDFGLREYCWPDATLWFIDNDQFTADEREAAYRNFVSGSVMECDR